MVMWAGDLGIRMSKGIGYMFLITRSYEEGVLHIGANVGTTLQSSHVQCRQHFKDCFRAAVVS